MLRKDAEKLVGKNVHCWTGLWGEYIGELVEVYGSPWRGNVKILEVVKYPVQGLNNIGSGFRERKPFNYEEIKDFGNSSIKPCNEPVNDYDKSLLTVLEEQIRSMESLIETCKKMNKNYGLELKGLETLKKHLTEKECVVDE